MDNHALLDPFNNVISLVASLLGIIIFLFNFKPQTKLNNKQLRIEGGQRYVFKFYSVLCSLIGALMIIGSVLLINAIDRHSIQMCITGALMKFGGCLAFKRYKSGVYLLIFTYLFSRLPFLGQIVRFYFRELLHFRFSQWFIFRKLRNFCF